MQQTIIKQNKSSNQLIKVLFPTKVKLNFQPKRGIATLDLGSVNTFFLILRIKFIITFSYTKI